MKSKTRIGMFMDLIEEIKKRSSYVDKGIEDYLPIDKPYELYKAARYLPDAGGKRLRPATVILAAEAVGSDLETVLPAAVAVELVHNFTLVHDDIMDRDDIRRGMPAVHVKWGRSRSYPCRRYPLFKGFRNTYPCTGRSTGTQPQMHRYSFKGLQRHLRRPVDGC